LARFEGDFRAGAKEPLTLNELLDLLSSGSDEETRARQVAIACYLSAGEGWREALKEIGGAFVEGEPGLRERQAD
jgi:hypothetical protein